MAKPLTHQRAINNLPTALRERVLDMLVNEESARQISLFLSQQGHKLSFAAIARYRRVDLPKHLETVRKLQRIEALDGDSAFKDQSVAQITNAALAADPYLSRIVKKYERLDRVLDAAEQSADYKAVAALDRADTAVMSFQAQLEGRLQQAQTNVAVQIVFGAPPAETPEIRPLASGSVIDLDPIR